MDRKDLRLALIDLKLDINLILQKTSDFIWLGFFFKDLQPDTDLSFKDLNTDTDVERTVSFPYRFEFNINVLFMDKRFDFDLPWKTWDLI